jgi:hypothetical protein
LLVIAYIVGGCSTSLSMTLYSLNSRISFTDE